MTATVSPEDGARLAAVMAIILQHRPGWGFSVGFHSGGFHAVVSAPEVQQIGRPGRLYAASGPTPSKALSDAFTASGPGGHGPAACPGLAALTALPEVPLATHAVRSETIQ